DADLEGVPLAPLTCGMPVYGPPIDDFESYAALDESLRQARPILDALVATAEVAKDAFGARSSDLADDLLHRPMTDQMYRYAFRWGAPDSAERGVPEMEEGQRIAFTAMLSDLLRKTDADNTEWLKEVIAEHGWPTISLVGEDASSRAWLLAQHADHDPAFQVQVLRLIEPLVAEGEVSKRNYEYLYDRVMLKVAGTQRYATQVTCEGGVREPRALDGSGEMNELRASVDLGTFEEYLTWFAPCPPAEES
ncbi:hypothetical protein N8940_02390, partial [Sphingomonadaceae bacterium]|nr:hypothetical protein [Sphingomonadaceae bacterium]